jgi:hypothetical protein
MNLWGMLLHGFLWLKNCRQFLVLDVNQREGFFGNVGRLGRHGDDLFPDETDAVTGKDWDIEQKPTEAHLR